MNSSTVSDHTETLQINTQHKKTSTGLLCQEIADLNQATVLIQEPWTNKKGILGLRTRDISLFQSCSGNNP